MNSEFQTHKHERAPEIFIPRESHDARQREEQRACGGAQKNLCSREVIDVAGEGCFTSKLPRTAKRKKSQITRIRASRRTSIHKNTRAT